MRILGIDPGLSGAMACFDEHDLLFLEKVPLKLDPAGKKDIDAFRLQDFLNQHGPYALCVFEQVHAQPGNGVVACFSFGRATGKVKAVLEVLQVPVIEPTPQAWKAVILAGTKKDKDAAIGYAQSRWPHADLRVAGSRKPSHDKAEALCMAEYGRRHLLLGGANTNGKE